METDVWGELVDNRPVPGVENCNFLLHLFHRLERQNRSMISQRMEDQIYAAMDGGTYSLHHSFLLV